jgi:hypothetical protein
VSRRRTKCGRPVEGDPGPRIFSAVGESGAAAEDGTYVIELALAGVDLKDVEVSLMDTVNG